MTDILIYETGGGGDLLLRGNDLVKVTGFENAPYLSMFGGNKWWGNYMIPDNPFSSQTEDVLKTTPLTSAGRNKIEEAINADLSFLKKIPGTTWKLRTTITNSNRLDIEIDINGQTFYYQWNPDSMYLTYRIA